MILHRLILLSLIPVLWCADSILITSIQLANDVGDIECATSKLNISNVEANATSCENGYSTTTNLTYITLTLNFPMKEENISFFLDTKVKILNVTANEQYSGVFGLESPKTNELLVGKLTMPKYVAPTTAAPTTEKPKRKRSAGFPEETENDETSPEKFAGNGDANTPEPVTLPVSNNTFLTMSYIVLHIDETKTQVNKNGGAVAVAIIEGIALICILAYMGYRTMVKHRMKEATMNAALYGYDSNSRITVPDSIRMSDIPPPRDPNYINPPPVSTVQQQQPSVRNSVMTTQELVVPQTSASTTRPTTTPSTTTNGQFNDPFDSLDSW